MRSSKRSQQRSAVTVTATVNTPAPATPDPTAAIASGAESATKATNAAAVGVSNAANAAASSINSATKSFADSLTNMFKSANSSSSNGGAVPQLSLFGSLLAPTSPTVIRSASILDTGDSDEKIATGGVVSKNSAGEEVLQNTNEPVIVKHADPTTTAQLPDGNFFKLRLIPANGSRGYPIILPSVVDQVIPTYLIVTGQELLTFVELFPFNGEKIYFGDSIQVGIDPKSIRTISKCQIFVGYTAVLHPVNNNSWVLTLSISPK